MADSREAPPPSKADLASLFRTLDSLKVRDLSAICGAHGLGKTGVKADLRGRIIHGTFSSFALEVLFWGSAPLPFSPWSLVPPPGFRPAGGVNLEPSAPSFQIQNHC